MQCDNSDQCSLTIAILQDGETGRYFLKKWHGSRLYPAELPFATPSLMTNYMLDKDKKRRKHKGPVRGDNDKKIEKLQRPAQNRDDKPSLLKK